MGGFAPPNPPAGFSDHSQPNDGKAENPNAFRLCWEATGIPRPTKRWFRSTPSPFKKGRGFYFPPPVPLKGEADGRHSTQKWLIIQ